jgi:hypothetical protein
MGASVSTPRKRDVRGILSRFHPLGFALFPLLSFYSANRGRLPPGDPTVFALLIFNLVVAAAAFGAFLLIMRNVGKAAIATSIALVAFFGYGPVIATLSRAAHVKGSSVGLQWTLLAFVLAGVGLAVVLLSIASEKRVPRLTAFFGVAALVLIVAPVGSIILDRAAGHEVAAAPVAADKTVLKRPANELPDIYYIVLDSYPRSDILRDILHYDNSDFINGLKKRGFYVTAHGNSNYADTFLSLPSTLNMRYLDDLPKRLGAGSRHNTVPLLMIVTNKVVPIMKSLGYKFVNVGSEWFATAKSKFADINFKTQGSQLRVGPATFGLDETSIVYLESTALRPLIEKRIRQSLQRTILNAFSALERIPSIPEPTFTFAHILIPHPPFLFDAKGRWIDDSALEAAGDVYLDRPHYVDQVAYTSRKALHAVDAILRKSKRPPIIVMAGDHGSTTLLGHPDKWGTPEQMGVNAVRERMGNLNVYYFPDRNYKNLYPTITPVNSFRLIFSQYFGLNYPLLPDRSYFSNYKAFYKYYDVTSLVRDGILPNWAK